MRERANQRGMSASYLEGDYEHDDDNNAISISAIKKRYKNDQKRTYRAFLYPSLHSVLFPVWGSSGVSQHPDPFQETPQVS